VWAPARPIGDFDRIFVEADAFAHRAHDTIALITTAGFVARATNLGDSQAYGAELVASARYARTLRVTANYTRLVTEQLAGDPSVEGKPVPREPGHALNARGDVTRSVGGHLGSLWLEANWQSTSFLDPASLGRVPGRVLVGAGARAALTGGLGLALSVANLGDLRVTHLPLDPPPSPSLTETPTALTDVAGFPLPGRSFYLTLDWTY
jgi:outer membrane receptor protein involved in Fe transport